MAKEIVSISGKPGLFKILSSTNTTLIVESLIDGKRLLAYTHTQQLDYLYQLQLI